MAQTVGLIKKPDTAKDYKQSKEQKSKEQQSK